MMARCFLLRAALLTAVLASSITMDTDTLAAAAAVQRVPPISSAVESSRGASGLLNYWRSCLRDAAKLAKTQEKDSSSDPADSTVIRLVVAPKTHVLANLAPQGSNKHPLYLGSPESRSLKADLVLDSLSDHGFSSALLQPDAELTVLNLNKRALKLKTDAHGKLTVNGVPGEVMQANPDGLTVIGLDDFLFDHRQRLQQLQSTAGSH